MATLIPLFRTLLNGAWLPFAFGAVTYTLRSRQVRVAPMERSVWLLGLVSDKKAIFSRNLIVRFTD